MTVLWNADPMIKSNTYVVGTIDLESKWRSEAHLPMVTRGLTA